MYCFYRSQGEFLRITGSFDLIHELQKAKFAFDVVRRSIDDFRCIVNDIVILCKLCLEPRIDIAVFELVREKGNRAVLKRSIRRIIIRHFARRFDRTIRVKENIGHAAEKGANVSVCNKLLLQDIPQRIVIGRSYLLLVAQNNAVDGRC